MKDFKLAVKAFIIKNNKIFLVKRSKKDRMMPEMWEPPGGRLEHGEDPILGLMREVREETGLYINIKNPLSIRHFKRNDNNQIITMITFLAKPIGGYLKISEEHEKAGWMDIETCKEKLGKFFWKEIDIYKKHFEN